MSPQDFFFCASRIDVSVEQIQVSMIGIQSFLHLQNKLYAGPGVAVLLVMEM